MTKRILPLWQYAFFIKKKNQALGLVHSFLNYREATSTLTPGPKVVVTATLHKDSRTAKIEYSGGGYTREVAELIGEGK